TVPAYRVTPRSAHRPQMVDRPGPGTELECGAGAQGAGEIVLRRGDRGGQVVAAGEPGGDRRGQGAAGAVGVGGVDPVGGQVVHAARGDQHVIAGLAAEVPALD